MSATLFLSVDTAFGQPTQRGDDDKRDEEDLDDDKGGPHAAMLQQLIDLQTGLNNIQTDVTAVQTDVSGVQADLTAVQADVGIVQSTVGNVKTGVEKLVTSDEENQSIVTCFEGSIGVEAEGALELVMGGHADAGVGAKAGTGAQADAFIDGAAVIKVGSVSDATIGLDLCTDLIKLSERLAQSSNTQATPPHYGRGRANRHPEPVLD